MSARTPVKPGRIPKQWEDFSPEWMTWAISRRHPGAKVRDVTVMAREDGTNRRARLGLTYDGGFGPGTVFVKTNDPAHRLVHLRNGNLFGEAQLFASGVPLDVDHPLVHASIVDRRRMDFLLVMEDLAARQADPRDATRPMSIDQVAHGVRGLARLHSQYWGFSGRTHPALRWVQTWEPTDGWQIGLKQRVPIGLDRGGADLPAEVTKYGGNEIVGIWARYVASLSKGPTTLLHGDAHIGNTYVLPDGDVGFLDWQVVRRGEWSQDIGYFLVGALTENDRQDSEADLVKEYRTSLDLHGGQVPSADEAWLRYRATPAYGLAIWLSTLGTDGWQPRDVSIALARRYARAFVELETMAALADLGV
jgi:Phosphotransferase enzyme family